MPGELQYLYILYLLLFWRSVECEPSISSVLPSTGSVLGGTVLRVMGGGFNGGTRFACQFSDDQHFRGSSLSHATFISSTEVTCVTPRASFLNDSRGNFIDITGGYEVAFMLTTFSTQSNKLPFVFVDLSTVSISTILPSQGLNSTHNTLQVIGTGFVDVTTVHWRIGTDHHGNCSYSNTTLYMCTLSPFPYPSLQLVQVTVDGSDTGLIQLEQNQTSFTFFSTSPSVLSVTFGPSYTNLVMELDREVELGGEAEYNTTTPPLCDSIFDVATLQLLGNRAFCKWKNTRQRRIVITIFNDTSVRIGSRMGVSEGVFRTRGVFFSRLNSMTVLEVGSSNGHSPFIPFAVITGPSVVPACSESDIVMTGIHSQNFGPHPLQYLWSVDVMSMNSSNGTDDDLSGVAMDSVLQYTPNSSTTDPHLTLPSSAFLKEFQYMITLTVMNFLGFYSNTSVILTKQPVEVVVSGDNYIRVNPLNDVIIGMTTEVTFCDSLPTRSLQLSWEMEDISNHDNISDVTHLLDTTTLLSPLLWIPGHTLLHGHHYRLTAQVTSQHALGVAVGYHSIEVESTYPNVDVRFVGGVQLTLPHNQEVYIDISPSFNLDYYMIEDLEFSWRCVSVTPPSPCMDALNGGLIVLPSTITHTIPPSHLSPGTYQITVDISGATWTSGSLLVTILPPAPPPSSQVGGVRIVTVERGRPCLRDSDETVISALVQTPEEGVIEWEGLFVPGHAHLTLSSNNTRTPTILPVLSEEEYSNVVDSESRHNLLATPTQWQAVSLVLPAHVLQSGEMYTFGLRYSVAMVVVAMTQVDILVCEVPTSGWLQVVPFSEECGVGLTLTALRWTDAPLNLPLLYQFGFALDTNQLVETSINWFGAPLMSNQLNTVLVSGAAVTTVTIILRVFNNKQSYSDSIERVPLPPATPCDLMSRLDSISFVFSNSNNYQQLLVDLAALLPLTTARSSVSNSSLSDAYQLIVSMATDVYAHLLPQTSFFTLSLLRILRTISSWKVTSNNDDVIRIVMEIFGHGGRSPNMSPVLKEGLNFDQGLAVLELLENILYSSDPIDTRLQSSRVSEVVVNTGLPSLGKSLCTQQGLGEEAVTMATSNNKVKLKASPTHFPKVYLLSDVVMETDVTVTVYWSNEVRQHFGARGSWRDCYRHGNIRGPCDGVCLTSVEYSDDVHWMGVEYAPFIKSTPISLTLISQSNQTILSLGNLAGGVSTVFPLVYGQGSPRGELQCVVWSRGEGRWTSDVCTSHVNIQSGTVTCTCSQQGDLAVVEACASGYYGNSCTMTCPQGLWGVECQKPCMCSGRGTCHASSGACNCTSGYIGKSCEQRCPDSRYGYMCTQECQCENKGVCSHVDGSCGCGPGWMGTRCDQACPPGYYGDVCQERCACRVITQCDRMTGKCDCDSGFRGPSCNSACPNGSFGVGCSSSCRCHDQGSVSCDRFNGSCYCHKGWSGEGCDDPPPQPVTDAPPTWAAAIGLIVVLIIVIASIIVIVVLVRRHKRRSRLKIEPSEHDGHVESNSIVLVKASHPPVGVEEGSEDELNLTKSTSFDVLVPQGSQLRDMFTKESSGPSFQEPAEIDGNPRWTIVHVYRKDQSSEAGGSGTDTPPSAGKECKVYPEGVYLPSSALLKDLRSAFIKSEQLEDEDKFFLFATGPDGQDTYGVDDESIYTLKDFEPVMEEPRTFYITAVTDTNDVVKELCVCGQVAEYDCARCETKGYCSEECQESDYKQHKKLCRRIRRQRKEDKRKQKLLMEPPDLCVCGKTALFECSNCGVRGYCSAQCQADHWPVHQDVCVFTPNRY